MIVVALVKQVHAAFEFTVPNIQVPQPLAAEVRTLQRANLPKPVAAPSLRTVAFDKALPKLDAKRSGTGMETSNYNSIKDEMVNGGRWGVGATSNGRSIENIY